MLALTPSRDITSEALSAASETARACLRMDAALFDTDRCARRLRDAWGSMPADCVHDYPFAVDLDELVSRGPGYVSARPDILARILRETGVPAYAEADGRLVFVTLDGQSWATALAGWHVQDSEALETCEALSARSTDLESRYAGELDLPAAPMALALLQGVSDYNRSTLRAHRAHV